MKHESVGKNIVELPLLHADLHDLHLVVHHGRIGRRDGGRDESSAIRRRSRGNVCSKTKQRGATQGKWRNVSKLAIKRRNKRTSVLDIRGDK